MKTIQVLKAFSYAYQGLKVVHYAPGQHTVPDECANLALQEGWAVHNDKIPSRLSALLPLRLFREEGGQA